MKIRLKTTMAGPDGSFQPGQIVDFERGRAYALIEGGYAEQIGGEEPVSEPEVATLPQPKTAIIKTGKARR
ncbi:hypothetical protein A6A04_13440 [Paramagnetospirillum marisnigri]|uniref:Uncharacterized protein n=1 Tax=Paramagnetospirillum marisnigri TaxID=1285242 RepID=A0A178MUE1_9PROT|nr:hypothetical protein [Paramagnetospirillum marisnigri]OAN53890.1 hypothetical protein A6A04_13440 [Paramagnetospirillum marisnigri]